MPRFRQTPLISIPWPGRGEILVKDESKCPTGTFKDRLAWRLADLLLSEGADRSLLVSSITLGNTAASLAAAFAESFQSDKRPQLLGVFPTGFEARTIGPDVVGRTMLGLDLLRDLEDRGMRCVQWPLYSGFLSHEDIAEIGRSAHLEFSYHRDVTNGIGVPAYEAILAEAWSQGAQQADVVVVPVGAGVLFDEFVSLVERSGSPARVLGVTTLNELSVADKIYGKYSPYFDSLSKTAAAHHPSNARHRILTVDDSSILSALRSLPKGVSAEPSAAAAFVPLDIVGEIDRTEKVLVINTGSGISTQLGILS